MTNRDFTDLPMQERIGAYALSAFSLIMALGCITLLALSMANLFR